MKKLENREEENLEKRKSEDVNFLGEIQDKFGTSKVKPNQYSALALAYIGDGVFDLIIRTIILDLGNGKVKDFHRATSGIVKAASQAKIVKTILEELTEEEEAIFRHGRNAKSATSAKNASIVDYRVATGFEALIGYLYLSYRMERAIYLVKIGLERAELMPKK